MSGYYEAYPSERDVPLWAEYEDDDYDPDEDGPDPEEGTACGFCYLAVGSECSCGQPEVYPSARDGAVPVESRSGSKGRAEGLDIQQPAETGDGNWRAHLNDEPAPF